MRRRLTQRDERVIIGPGVGLDTSVVRVGEQLLVFKSDSITFATEDIGYYLVRVNANDLAATGAQPRWILVTMLLPEHQTTANGNRPLLADIGFCSIPQQCRFRPLQRKSVEHSAWTCSERFLQVRFCSPRDKRQRARFDGSESESPARKSAESNAGRTACGQFSVNKRRKVKAPMRDEISRVFDRRE